MASAASALDAGVPVRSDDLVLALLGRALDRLPRHEAEDMAEEVGATYGRAMAAGLTGDTIAAGQRSLRSAMQAGARGVFAHRAVKRGAKLGFDREVAHKPRPFLRAKTPSTQRFS